MTLNLAIGPGGERPARFRGILLRPALVASMFAIMALGYLLDEFLLNVHGLAVVSMIFCMYLLTEIYLVWQASKPGVIWINPVVACSIVTLLVPFGLTNVSIIGASGGSGISAVDMRNLLVVVSFASLGAVSMWAGYRSRFGRVLGRSLRRRVLASRFVRGGFELSPAIAWSMLVISVLARLVEIRLGVFGYTSVRSRLFELAAYRQVLGFASSLGLAVLLAVSISWFSRTGRRPLHLSLLLGFSFVLEILFGVLVGYKRTVILPVLLVTLVGAALQRHFRRRDIVAVVFAFIVAYNLVEPLRAYRHADTSVELSDPGVLLDAARVAAVESITAGEGARGLTDIVAHLGSRLNWTAIAAIAIAHEDYRSADLERLQRQVFFAPIHATVPRLLWPEKPYHELGAWFNAEVLHRNTINAVAMSPVAFMYILGGLPAVMGGFWLLGVVQRTVWRGLFLRRGGALFCFFGVFEILVRVDSAVYSIIVNLIRLPVLLLLAQALLFRRRPRHGSRTKFR